MQAAEKGEAEQMLMLASMLETGYGCTADKKEAKVWAERGNSKLQQNAVE